MAASFLQDAESAITHFDQHFRHTTELKEVKKQERLRRYQKTVESVQKLKQDVDRTMHDLNIAMEHKLKVTTEDANQTTQEFKEHKQQ